MDSSDPTSSTASTSSNSSSSSIDNTTLLHNYYHRTTGPISSHLSTTYPCALFRSSRVMLSKVNWGVLISFLSFCITTWYYVNILTLTRHLQQANTLGLFHAEYSSPKILEAFELVEDFIEERGHSPEHYAQAFLQLRARRGVVGRQLDRARRRLVHWFSRLQYFYEFGFLTEDYLLRFPGSERAQHFIDLVEPLDYLSRIATGRKPSAVFDFLRTIYNLSPSSLHLDLLALESNSHSISHFNETEVNRNSLVGHRFCQAVGAAERPVSTGDCVDGGLEQCKAEGGGDRQNNECRSKERQGVDSDRGKFGATEHDLRKDVGESTNQWERNAAESDEL